MDGATAAVSLGVVVQIIFLDLLLSGDNALVIALACRHLPPEQARRAAWAGAAGAISLRVFLTLMASELMTLPLVQLVSALPLLVIALNLMNGEDEAAPSVDSARAEATMLAAVGIIILSDAAMSVDNVVAVAAVSGGNVWLLVFGLALSIPLIVFGSFGFSMLMRAYPWLVDLGAGLLGWVAGGMIAQDPLFTDWIDTQAPALNLALPLAGAIFVMVQGRFGREKARRAREAPQALRQDVEVPRQLVEAPRRRVATAPPVEALQPPVEVPPPPQPAPPAEPAPPPLPEQAETFDAVALEDVQAPARDAEAEKSPEFVPPFGLGRAVSSDDRLIAMGLIALFVIFGVFLLIFILIPD